MSDQARRICSEVRRRVRYKAEPKGRDHWQKPEETLKLGTGDCDDFAILTLSMCRKAKVQARMVIFYNRKAGHAVCAGSGWYASNGNYFRTNNLAGSVTAEMRVGKLMAIEVGAAMLRKKGIRI